jgi:guanine deaminase
MRADHPDDPAWLALAIELASANVADGGGPFGAVITRDGEEVARGTNQVTRDLDPTAHAEVVAIREACRKAGDFRLTGHTLYASCEPCPMCMSSALWARVDRVVFAATRDDAAAAGFDDRALYELFQHPRETWDVPVVGAAVTGATAPFDAWRAKTDRAAY